MIGLNHLNVSYFAITHEVPVKNIQGKGAILQIGLFYLEDHTLVKLWVILLPDSVGAGSLCVVVGAQGHPYVRVRRAVKEAEPCVVCVREALAIQHNHLESDLGLWSVWLQSKDRIEADNVDHETD